MRGSWNLYLSDARRAYDLAVFIHKDANPIGPVVHGAWSVLGHYMNREVRILFFDSSLRFHTIHLCCTNDRRVDLSPANFLKGCWQFPPHGQGLSYLGYNYYCPW
jgi:hypothetical protein